MKRLLPFLGALLFAFLVLTQGDALQSPPDDAARVEAMKLFQSLTLDQKKLALKDAFDKDRYAEVFPGVKRNGLPVNQLTVDQKKQLGAVLRAMTSEYGAGRVEGINKQNPEGARYVNFFGEPSAENPFAFRLAEHHLTLVYAEFAKDPVNQFGPILLGGNPVNDLWKAEDDIFLALYQALTDEEKKQVQAGKASPGSGNPIGEAGIKIADLSPKSKALAVQLFEKRLDFFSAERRKVLDSLVKKEGGPENLRLWIQGKGDKSHRMGGSYHWRIGNANVVADWQTAGAQHLHLTLRVGKKG